MIKETPHILIKGDAFHYNLSSSAANKDYAREWYFSYLKGIDSVGTRLIAKKK